MRIEMEPTNKNFSIAELFAKFAFQKNQSQSTTEKKIQELMLAHEFENALKELKEHQLTFNARAYDDLINEIFSKWLDFHPSKAFFALASENQITAQANEAPFINKTIPAETLKASSDQEREDEEMESFSESSHELERLKNSHQDTMLEEPKEPSLASEEQENLSKSGQDMVSDEPPRNKGFEWMIIENYLS